MYRAQHILPFDFASRNVPSCEDERCQICSVISCTQESVVRSTSVQDVLAGSMRLPFTSRLGWQYKLSVLTSDAHMHTLFKA